MKEALPKDKEAKIAKDARETVQECVSDFISFITSEACDKCTNDKRRTINGNDLIYAMRQLGFERYVENIELYYEKYTLASKKLSEENHNQNTSAAQEEAEEPGEEEGANAGVAD